MKFSWILIKVVFIRIIFRVNDYGFTVELLQGSDLVSNFTWILIGFVINSNYSQGGILLTPRGLPLYVHNNESSY